MLLDRPVRSRLRIVESKTRFIFETLRPFTGTRLGGCTGDLRVCANVPRRRDPRSGLAVVLGIFGPQLLGNKGKFPGGACLMGAAGQKWPFPHKACMAYEHRLGSNSV